MAKRYVFRNSALAYSYWESHLFSILGSNLHVPKQVESRGSTERSRFQADEDCTSARDVPDAHPSGGDTYENAGGRRRRSCRLERTISP